LFLRAKKAQESWAGDLTKRDFQRRPAIRNITLLRGGGASFSGGETRRRGGRRESEKKDQIERGRGRRESEGSWNNAIRRGYLGEKKKTKTRTEEGKRKARSGGRVTNTCRYDRVWLREFGGKGIITMRKEP